MSWRNNWLLALPPYARLLPPLALAFLGGGLLVWVHDRASDGSGANLAALVWFTIGLGMLVRPAQPLLVSAAALGMTGLALQGVLELVSGVDSDLWRPEDAARAALWSLLALFALPAGLGEALPYRPVLARRFYFAAVALFFLEGGVHRLLGAEGGRPSESVFFFLVACFALFSVFIAERTTAVAELPAAPPDVFPRTRSAPAADLNSPPAPAPPRRPRLVCYLDEPLPPAAP
jgi:uncharacterized membrane protein HdeD (DUF308 family)